MLKEEAISVLRYGNDVVTKLTAAANDLEVGVDITDEDLGMVVICKQKLMRSKRWYGEQKSRLSKIAAGLRSVATSSNIQEEEGEQADEVDDEEPADPVRGLKT